MQRIRQISRHLPKSKFTTPSQVQHTTQPNIRSLTTAMAPKTPTDITLYTVGTPNGIKVSILLEELNLDYKVHPISMTNNEQKEPWFLEINPNGRIPAITDKTPEGETIRVFESGAILEYLIAKYDKDNKVSYPYGSKEHWEVTSWLMWQMGGLGPMQGQANHFNRYAPEDIPYGKKRYTNETRRLYRTIDDHLKKTGSPYLVGDKATVADIASWGWVASSFWSGVDIEEFPLVKKWLYHCLERPGFEAGRNIPTRHTALDQAKKSKEELDADAAKSRAWIQQSMKEEAK